MARHLPPRSARAAWLALLLGACATHPGHYYAEDGPPERVPADIASTPDAVPRDEPLNPYANRPYKALGRTYVPDTSDAPFTQRGMASWYGRQFHGNRTASGEPYDMFAMTAAHPTLPIPSYARVTSVHDGRSVIVRINDRGPFLNERIIDLSYAAAVRLGLAVPGSGEVVVEKIEPRLLARAPSGAVPAAAGGAAGQAGARTDATVGAGETIRPEARVTSAAVAAAPVEAATTPVAATTSAGSGATVGTLAPEAAPPTPPAPLAPVPLAPAPRAQTAPAEVPVAPSPTAVATPLAGPTWSVQLGAFAVAANAAALRDRLALLLAAPEAARLPAAARNPRVENEGGLNRVLIGSLRDRATAQEWARAIGGFLVRETVLYVH